ncbi:MAG: hypothetical protein H6Q32_1374, partial [Bacteroidetes bacterium]|nr:hypothetical protein [Bacteroidota bacterium]
GKEWDAPLAVTNGDADYGEGKSLTKHYRIRDAVIAYNTLVDNESGLEIGFDGAGFQTNWWFYPPQGLTVANNILVSSKDTAIRIFTAPLNSTWTGNIVHAKGSGKLPAFKSNGVLEADPLLERSEGFLRPSAKSPALGAAREIAFHVRQDVEGQSRKSPYDVGADQRSDEKALNRPLTARDVGPHSAE